MNNDIDLKNYWQDENKVKKVEKKLKLEEELIRLKKENEKIKIENRNNNIFINNEKREKEDSNSFRWIIIQVVLNIVLLTLIFDYDFDIFLIPFSLNFIIFWFYTIYKILKYDFKYNKTIWVLICIFLPFLAIFFPAFENDMIIKE